MTYLDGIVAAHRERAAADDRARGDGPGAGPGDGGRPRPFRAGAGGHDRRGRHRRDQAPVAVQGRPGPGPRPGRRWPAATRRAGPPACRCSPTAPHFGGSPADLAAARPAVAVPVLRKDFTVDEVDVCDARLMGADAVLLIVAALDDAELRAFAQLAAELGLAALVEVHDEAELERALAAGADLIGVNQRDLTTFEVDTHRAVRPGRPAAGRRGPRGRVRHHRAGRRRRPRRRRLRRRPRGRDPGHLRRPRGRHGEPGGRRNRPRRRDRATGSVPAVFVKICGITSEEDALLAVAMGADAVGFVFAPSPRQIAPDQVPRHRPRLPPEILTVGVFRDEAPRAGRRDRADGRPARRAQLHGHETPELDPRGSASGCRSSSRRSRPATRRSTAATSTAPTPSCSTRPRPGSGQVFDWSLADGMPGGPPGDPRRRAHAGQRGRRHRPGPPVGRRRVDRGRGRRRAARTRASCARSSSAARAAAPPEYEGSGRAALRLAGGDRTGDRRVERTVG